MKHSDKMINFLQNRNTKPIEELGIGCPECGRKLTRREGNIGYCENDHGIQL